MKFHRVIPTLFFFLLIFVLFGSIGELKTLEAFDLELTKTFNQSSPNPIPSGTIVNVPPGALVKGKLFHLTTSHHLLFQKLPLTPNNRHCHLNLFLAFR
jgi:hypothetical protein